MRHHPVPGSPLPLLLSQPFRAGWGTAAAVTSVPGAALGCGGHWARAGARKETAPRPPGRGGMRVGGGACGGGAGTGAGRRGQVGSEWLGGRIVRPRGRGAGPGEGGLESGNIPIKLPKVPPPHVRPMTLLPPNFPPARRYKSRQARSPRPTPRHLAGSPAPAPGCARPSGARVRPSGAFFLDLGAPPPRPLPRPPPSPPPVPSPRRGSPHPSSLRPPGRTARGRRRASERASAGKLAG